jgi:hypothetical protein
MWWGFCVCSEGFYYNWSCQIRAGTKMTTQAFCRIYDSIISLYTIIQLVVFSVFRIFIWDYNKYITWTNMNDILNKT